LKPDRFLSEQLIPLPYFQALIAVLRNRLAELLMANTHPHIRYQQPRLAEQKQSVTKQLQQHQFWWLGAKTNHNLMIYDRKTGLIWDGKPNISEAYVVNQAQKKLADLSINGLSQWTLPTKQELVAFAMTQNPLKSGGTYRLRECYAWLCDEGYIDLDNCPSPSVYLGSPSRLLACNRFASKLSSEQFVEAAIKKGWQLRVCGQQDAPDLLDFSYQLSGQNLYKDIDYKACRLPELEPAIFTDPNKGLWELWGLSDAELQAANARSRNPANDVKDSYVAIDFGTSSTVVAYDENGVAKLLRIGVDNFWEQPQPAHYENPTILEMLDFRKFIRAWQTQAYRPAVDWDQVRCSHEALQNFRNNNTDEKVVASMFSKIKQWALREADGERLRLTDQINNHEHLFAPLSLRMPVKGQPLTVSADDDFDPVELYAWFLGLVINWRGRGIFLRYFMTFPVAYPKPVKEKILASFRRGLQRSLPETLINQPEFQNFAVDERASEPAAYAAAALPQLDIDPTETGIGYAVFDFGGGTTDFDFGFYRLANDKEDAQGYEAVFEHFGAAGDRFLGGENLLENLAYRVFQANLTVCREKKIAFSKPLDAEDFTASEMFLERTQAAATNTLMLMTLLRPLWETGELASNTGAIKISLLNREGQKQECQLTIPKAELLSYLEQRIEQGVQNFFAAMKIAFAERLPKQVHVLLAGNASRSALVAGFFGLDSADNPFHQRTREYCENLFGLEGLEVLPYAPLPANPKEPYQPTAKTGVAIGLLRLCPGSVVKVVNHAAESADGEAPFSYFVGRTRLSKFQPAISRNDVYGQWFELGVPRERVFNLFYTQSPSAHTGGMREGDAELKKRRLEFAGHSDGQKVYAKPTGPAEIEVCTALSMEAVLAGQLENQQVVKFA
jgi:hypothetical protein